MENFHMIKDLVRPQEWLVKVDLKDAYFLAPRSPQIPPVPVARSDIPVLLPAIRPVLCSESVHKADETSGGFPEGERNETNHLFGRHTGDQQLPGGSKGICSFNQGSLQFSGPNHQQKEITTGALTGGSIFGVSYFNSENEHLSAIRKDEENSARSDAFVEGGVSVNPTDYAFIGMTNAVKQAIPMAPMYHRQLQALINRVIPLVGSEPQAMRQSYHNQVELTVEAREELTWWSQAARNHNAAPIIIPPPDLVIETDASLVGWGARCLDQRTGGLWSVKEQELHINALELTAVLLAIQTFTKERKHQHILVRTDNTTAKSYINHIGGTHSPTINAIALNI